MSLMSDKLAQAEMSCFVRCVGVSDSYEDDILELDRIYDGRGYLRVDKLDVPQDRDEVEKLRLEALDFQNDFEGARVLALYHESVASVNPSIENNLIISLLYRSKLLSEIAGILVCGGKIGYKEYLFCYLAYLRGWKVLMLMPEGEGNLAQVLAEKSERLELGAEYPAMIPPYIPRRQNSTCAAPTVSPARPAPYTPPERPAQRSPETGNIRVAMPPRDRSRNTGYAPPAPPQATTYIQPAPQSQRSPITGNIRVKIPPRPQKRRDQGRREGGLNWYPVRRDDRYSPGFNAPPRPTQPAPRNMPGSAPVRRPAPDNRRSFGADERRELSYEELARRAESVVMIAICNRYGDMTGSGSGIAIGSDGFILTNCHVIGKGTFFQVRLENDDRSYPAQVIKYNSVQDMAVIRIPARLRPLPLYRSSRELVRGQKVFAIGSPMGLFNSVSDGIISGFRTVGAIDTIQFTAPISPGSSGGALLDTCGELVGMCFGGVDKGQNLNLAVSCRSIAPFIGGFTDR